MCVMKNAHSAVPSIWSSERNARFQLNACVSERVNAMTAFGHVTMDFRVHTSIHASVIFYFVMYTNNWICTALQVFLSTIKASRAVQTNSSSTKRIFIYLAQN